MKTSATNYTKNKQTNKKNDRQNPRTNGKSKAIQTKSHTEAYTYTLTKREKGKYYIYRCSQVHLLSLGWFVVYSGIPQMQGTSSWLWIFNPLLLRLLGEISLSFLCSHSSRGSALDFDLPLRLGRLRASVLHSDRTGLKEQLIQGLWLTQASGREGYGCGESLWRQRLATSKCLESILLFILGRGEIWPWISTNGKWHRSVFANWPVDPSHSISRTELHYWPQYLWKASMIPMEFSLLSCFSFLFAHIKQCLEECLRCN